MSFAYKIGSFYTQNFPIGKLHKRLWLPTQKHSCARSELTEYCWQKSIIYSCHILSKASSISISRNEPAHWIRRGYDATSYFSLPGRNYGLQKKLGIQSQCPALQRCCIPIDNYTSPWDKTGAKYDWSLSERCPTKKWQNNPFFVILLTNRTKIHDENAKSFHSGLFPIIN